MAFTLVAALACISAVVAVPLDEGPKSFFEHRLMSVERPSLRAFDLAKELSERGMLDLWHESRNASILFSVAPEHFKAVNSALKESNCEAEILEENLQGLIDQEAKGLTYAGSASRPLNLRQFESYDQIVESINFYANAPNSSGHISTFNIGKSYEGRDIVGIKISNSMEKKPIIFVECGIHAREWASTSSCLYMIDQLAANQDAHKDLLDRFEFHMIPSSNPDGYEYTRSNNRLWRKNRRPQGSNMFFRCWGVDLNRNFEAGPHCGIGTEKNPCSEVYCGTKAFSEPETVALRDYMESIKDNVEYYVSLHAYGLMWMFPYSHTEEHCPHHEELLGKAKIAVDAIKEKTGTQYRYGPIAETIYAVTGSSIDWAYTSLKVTKSYVLEVQPSLNGAFAGRGFLLPASQIIPVGDETFTGLKAMWLS